MPQNNSKRIRFVSSVILLAAFGVLFRLYFLQVVHGETYSSKAERQYVNTNTTAYDRGDIYFESRTGEISPAAMTRSGYTLAMNPSLITEPEAVYKELSSLVNIDKNTFLAKASKKDDPYEEIARKINSETSHKIQALDIKGLVLSDEKWRFYPGETLAAQTLGFVSYKEDELAGRYGLERYYEDILKKDPSEVYNNFFAELFSNIQGTINGEAEGDLITTIEPSVQHFLEEKLSEIRTTWSSDTAGGIIINPQTGDIYAMAMNPNFDLNNFQSEKNPRIYSNPLVENVFEMGSIIKALTMAAGLDSGTVTANTTYYDGGSLTLNSKKISNYDGRGRGTVPMQEVLNQSLNTGAAYVALKMGAKFPEYMRNYGIGTETGIDLPNETKGLISNLDSPREIEMATASYGQGIAMTPVETVRALSVLANGGYLITPHLVKKVQYDTGLFKKLTYEPGKRVISEEASDEITRMLVKVVDEALAGGKVKLSGYSIAAKTGTAQMSDEGRAGYVEGKYLHSFFGYFPAYDPKFLVFLFHTYPKGVRYASETLTTPFMDMTKFLINYYEIPPDRGDGQMVENTE